MWCFGTFQEFLVKYIIHFSCEQQEWIILRTPCTSWILWIQGLIHLRRSESGSKRLAASTLNIWIQARLTSRSIGARQVRNADLLDFMKLTSTKRVNPPSYRVIFGYESTVTLKGGWHVETEFEKTDKIDESVPCEVGLLTLCALSLKCCCTVLLHLGCPKVSLRIFVGTTDRPVFRYPRNFVSYLPWAHHNFYIVSNRLLPLQYTTSIH